MIDKYNKDDKEYEQILLDYYQFDFKELPLIQDKEALREEGLLVFTFIYYNVLFVYDATNKDTMMWTLDKESDPTKLVWFDGAWESEVTNEEKEEIISVYRFCVQQKDVLEEMNDLSHDDLISHFKDKIGEIINESVENDDIINIVGEKPRTPFKTIIYSIKQWLISILEKE